MAKEDPFDQPYLVTKLNLLFAISSLVLVLTVLWMVWDDYEREWKDYQRQFMGIERQLAQQEVQQALEALDQEKRDELQRQVEEARSRMQQQQSEIDAAEAEMDKLEAELYRINQQYQFAKSIYDSAKYRYESATVGHSDSNHDASGAKADLDKAQADLDERERQLQDITQRHKDQKEKLAGYEADLTRLEAQRKESMAQVDRVELRLKAVSRPWIVEKLLNAPLLDFMRPSLKVEQVVLDKLEFNLNFMAVPRVDRCQTCHLGAARDGFQGVSQPFASHPRLDVFLSSSSPHPVDTYGCTVCHLGRDRATSFYGSAHTPRTPEQRADWEQRLDWHPKEHWDFPMLAATHTEASCYGCHVNQVLKPGAPRLNKALMLVERSGCFGCHKISGFENLRQVGPDLRNIDGKLTREWTFKWIKDPRAFNAHARMPKFFDLPNTSEPEYLARNNVEAHAITEYLFNKSEKYRPGPVPPRGNAAVGRQLVQNIGCLGCHITSGDQNPPERADYRRFGPALENLGSKTSEAWLYHWLKNPREYFPDTYMPDMRLTDREAADVTAYLLSERSSAFDSASVPALDRKIRDDIAIEYLTRTLTVQEAQQRLQEMNDTARSNYVGEKLINRYGCFGCHAISGFEKTQPIGTELSDQGNKSVERLDFAYLELERTMPAWLKQKFLHPRSFDEGLVKKPEEKLKMPYFNFSEEEADLLITAVLSFRDDRIDPTRKRNLDAREVPVEEGRRLIQSRNCRGCHLLQGVGGAIKTTLADVGFAPPPLDGEGRKVQADWLVSFIKAPTTIRPWLNIRMPSFHFTDREVTTLVRSFAYADKQDFPYETYDFSTTAESLTNGKQLFDLLRCQQCHIVGAIPEGKEAADMAPDLRLARSRLKPTWIVDWILDPQALQEGTRMPTFFSDGVSPLPQFLGGSARRQSEALRDHILSLGRAGAAATAAGGQD